MSLKNTLGLIAIAFGHFESALAASLHDDQKAAVSAAKEAIRDTQTDYEAQVKADVQAEIDAGLAAFAQAQDVRFTALEGRIAGLEQFKADADSGLDEIDSALSGDDTVQAEEHPPINGTLNLGGIVDAVGLDTTAAAPAPDAGAAPADVAVTAANNAETGTAPQAAQGDAGAPPAETGGDAPGQSSEAAPVSAPAATEGGDASDTTAAAPESSPPAPDAAAVDSVGAGSMTVTPVVVPASQVLAAGNAIAPDGSTIVTLDGAPTGQATFDAISPADNIPTVEISADLASNAPKVVTPDQVIAAGNAVSPDGTGTVVTAVETAVGDVVIPAGTPTGEVVDPSHPDTASIPNVEVHGDAPADADDSAAAAPEASEPAPDAPPAQAEGDPGAN